ncbi:MAG: hypothetical protein AAB573_00130 [Patescibacteria group bacterium]
MKYFFIFIAIALMSLPSSVHAARLWSSGFELSSVTAGVEITSTGGATAPTISSSNVRSGAYALRVNPSLSDTVMNYDFEGTDIDIAYTRFYLYIASAPSSDTSIVEFTANGSDTTVCGIRLNANNTLRLYADDSSTPIGSASSALSTGTWYRIELTCDATNNSDFAATGRIDGTQFASGSLGSGSATNIGRLELGVDAGNWGDTASADLYFDDAAVNDTNGSDQTSWPGTGSIVHMQPDSAGDTNNCTTGDYTSIDEITPDDAATVCVLDTNGDILEVNVESALSAGIDYYDTVSVVMIGTREAQASASSDTLAPLIRSASGGTRLSGTSYTHNDVTYRTNGDTLPRNHKLSTTTDPTTGVAWTPTGTNSLDNLQFGFNCSTCTVATNLSTLWALVEYVDGVPPAVKNRLNLRGTLKIRGGGRVQIRAN